MLWQRVNALTGESEWVIVRDGGDDEEKDGLEATLYLDMLNDRARNAAFSSAIAKLPRHGHVLDIGAGTGLLSMMVCRAMGRQCRVTACESFLPMYKLARRVVRDNGMLSAIKLLHTRSDEIQVGVDMSSRADALVCEILDSELLGEGIIPSLRHAHENLLQPNAATVPYRAIVYAQLVESDFLWRCNDLVGVEDELRDGMAFVPKGFGSFLKNKQWPSHVDAIPSIKQLSEPFEAFALDFYKFPNSRGTYERSVALSSSGTVHAIVSWWVLQLDKDGLIYYSTAPRWVKGQSQWCDHWKQCVWFLPGQGVDVLKDSKLEVVVNHDETSVWYDVQGNVRFSNDFSRSLSLKMSPERTRMLGNPNRRSIIHAAIQKALEKRKFGTCLILGDSLMSVVSVLRTGTSFFHVSAMFPAMKTDGLAYMEKIPGFKEGSVAVVPKEVKELTEQDFNGRKLDFLIGEPYYSTYEYELPWKQLRFWYERTSLSPLLSIDPIIIPCRGILYGLVCHLPDLWHSRCSLEKVEGFDHSAANTILGANKESPILPFFVWQCGEHEALTEPFPLLEFNLYQEIHSITGNVAKVPVIKAGVCHGIVLWMDWLMDSENKALRLSSGHLDPDARYCWKQGVKLLQNPLVVAEDDIEVQASFDSDHGEIAVAITGKT